MMNRRKFIRNTTLATTGAISIPYILPSGRLFAATGARAVNHVVFCLFAGGIRNIESVKQAEGNLLPTMLNYGTPSTIPGLTPLPSSPLPQPLMNYGTLFREFRYSNGPTGHYNGHTTAVTGVYTSNDLNIKLPPQYPTIFEYYRKHNTPTTSALNCWWVSDSLGPYPALNFSTYPGYGAMYGANFIAPTFLISEPGYNSLGNMKNFTTDEDAKIAKIKDYLDKNFSGQYNPSDAGITNDANDAINLKKFISRLFTNAISGQYNDPWGTGASAMNNDMLNIVFAEEIIKEYTPELLVVNMQGVDICHSDFTRYCNNLRKADFAVAHLWDTIQKTPGMANDTVMILVPEHGRNLQPNSLVDAYGRLAIDHTGDNTSREIFCLVAGPSNVVKQGQILDYDGISQPIGESIEVVPAIANLLGFESSINTGLLKAYNSSGIKNAFL